MSVTGTVKFNDRAAEILSWKSKLVRVIVPEGSETADVFLTTSGGGNATDHPNFTYRAPALRRVAPAKSFAGKRIVLTGSNFGSASPACSIDFGGTVLLPGTPSVVKWTGSSIKVVVPAGTGIVNVSVTTSAGTSLMKTFTYK